MAAFLGYSLQRAGCPTDSLVKNLHASHVQTSTKSASLQTSCCALLLQTHCGKTCFDYNCRWWCMWRHHVAGTAVHGLQAGPSSYPPTHPLTSDPPPSPRVPTSRVPLYPDAKFLTCHMACCCCCGLEVFMSAVLFHPCKSIRELCNA